MVSGIFTIFFFLIIFIVVSMFIGALRMFCSLRDFTQKINRQQPSGNAQSRRYGAGNSEVIDTRSQEKANRKIFSKDEGEFVDYKEE